MIFAIPAQAMSVKQVAQLRKMVPEDTKVGSRSRSYVSVWGVWGVWWGSGGVTYFFRWCAF